MNPIRLPLSRLSASLLTLCALLGGVVRGHSDVTVKVDSTQPWQGYMNVWQTDGSTYAFGSVWAIADLRAAFIPPAIPPIAGWPLNTALVLRPNTNTYDPANAYWNYPDGSPNKIVEANFYRDVGTNFAGQTVTFMGTVNANSMPAPTPGLPATGWTNVAFVKEFSVGYQTFYGSTEVPVTTAGAFTVSRPIPAGRVCQYGFYVKGPNTAPGSANSLTSLNIAVEDSDPGITNQPVGATITSGMTTNLSVGAIGSGGPANLSYQWKTNGVNLVNGAKYSGVTTKTLTIANAQVSDSGSYTVTVVNTVNSMSVDSDPAQLTVLDVLVTASPVDQRVEQGSTAVFSVTASSSSSLTYLWRSVIGGVTNFVINGPNVSGAFTPTLTLSNVQPASSGLYFLTITASSGFVRAGATLLVKTYAEYPNFLENAGFENDPTGATDSPWVRFESTDPSFGHLQSASDFYYGGGNVNVYAGTYVSYTTFNAAYSGIYQDVIATPGQIFAADMHFYNPSGDPLPGWLSSATNENYLEVQFRAGDDPTPIQQYLTIIMTSNNTPQNVWFQLPATNAGTYGFNPPTSNAKYLVAPPLTTSVRFQLTMHDIANSTGAGSIYYDSARLMLKLPVTVSTSQVGGNIVLSWKSLGSTSYQVQYTDNLNNASWHDLGAPVPGTGLVVSKSDAITAIPRFYRVLTL
jgi:hypothetical protein